MNQKAQLTMDLLLNGKKEINNWQKKGGRNTKMENPLRKRHLNQKEKALNQELI